MKTHHDVQIYIFRHGETDWNRDHILQGHLDTNLNDTGRTQALELQKFFKENPVDHFFSSDLMRAYETCLIARGELKSEIQKFKELRECHLGIADGMSKDQILQRFGDDFWQNWISVLESTLHLRFEGGESKQELRQRLKDFFRVQLGKFAGKKIGVATHGLVIKHLLHSARPDLKEQILTTNCGLHHFTYDLLGEAWTWHGFVLGGPKK